MLLTLRGSRNNTLGPKVQRRPPSFISRGMISYRRLRDTAFTIFDFINLREASRKRSSPYRRIENDNDYYSAAFSTSRCACLYSNSIYVYFDYICAAYPLSKEFPHIATLGSCRMIRKVYIISFIIEMRRTASSHHDVYL